MTQPNHEPLDDEERELMDPDTWEDEGIVMPGATGRTARIATDYDHDELVLLSRAAERAGESVVAFVRRAALEVALRERDRHSAVSRSRPNGA